MPKLNGKLPKYRKHKNSGRAVVTLNGADHYLGAFGSDESREKYDRLIAEWLGRARRPEPTPTLAQTLDEERPVIGACAAVSVNRLIHGYWQHAEVHYRKLDGSTTSELDNVRQVSWPF